MDIKQKAREVAAKNMDWQQVVFNGGPPCFHLEGINFCGRAQSWAGHPLVHRFISLAAALQSAVDEEREACAKTADSVIGTRRGEVAAAIRARGRKGKP